MTSRITQVLALLDHLRHTFDRSIPTAYANLYLDEASRLLREELEALPKPASPDPT